MFVVQNTNFSISWTNFDLWRKSYFITFLNLEISSSLLYLQLEYKTVQLLCLWTLKLTMSLFFCGTRTWIYIFNFQSQVSICEALVLNSIDLVSLKSHCYVDHYKNACFIKRKPWNYFKRFWHRFREGYQSSHFYKNERFLAKYRDSRYVDADSQRYSCKSMLQNYAANLHKGVPAGAFSHQLNACSLHYTNDCTALFSLT